MRETICATAALETAKAITLSERAYVKISHLEAGINIGLTGTAQMTVKVKNFGRTPARITDVILTYKLLLSTEPLPTAPDYSATPALQPLQAFLVTEDELFFSRTFALGPQNNDLEDGTKRLWLYGYVDYIDTFGERHRAGYASRYSPGPTSDNLTMVAQEAYNYDRPRKKGEGNDWDELPN